MIIDGVGVGIGVGGGVQTGLGLGQEHLQVGLYVSSLQTQRPVEQSQYCCPP